MCKVLVVYGKASLLYSFPGEHPITRRRIEAFWRQFTLEGLHRKVEVLEPPMAREEDLLLFHDRGHLKYVRRASEEGYGYLDEMETPAFKGVYEAASYATGGMLKALERVMEGKADHAFNPVGGFHHARRKSAGGFCVFNDVAIAIEACRERYNCRRILYVDIDAHHGDGVFYAFYGDPDVYILDIHEDGRYLYPGTGFAHEKGEGKARGTKMNIPLPPFAETEEFLEALGEVEELAGRAEPEIILLQAGADSLEEDPLAHLNLSTRAHAETTRTLHRLAHRYSEGRLIALGGGGYNLDSTALAWVEVVKALLEQ